MIEIILVLNADPLTQLVSGIAVAGVLAMMATQREQITQATARITALEADVKSLRAKPTEVK